MNKKGVIDDGRINLVQWFEAKCFHSIMYKVEELDISKYIHDNSYVCQ